MSFKPWGRLTLQSGKPRMDSNVSSNILYYTPFENNEFMELSLNMAGQIHLGKLYDVYTDSNFSGLSLSAPWLNSTTPAEARVQDRGLWFHASNGKLYLGTIYCSNNNFVKWQTRLTPTPYGTNNDLGVFNAYNRLSVTATCRDLNAEWQFAGNGALRFADNSNMFRINWVDGLGDVFCEGTYLTSVAGVLNAGPAAATVGVQLNADYPNLNLGTGTLEQSAMNHHFIGMSLRGTDYTNGNLGRNYWQAIEQSTAVPIGFFGNNFACLTAKLEL